MTNVTPITDVATASTAAIEALQKLRTKWDTAQQAADVLLYNLMDGCLRLVRLCEDEGYAIAVKNIAQFKFGKKTPITVIIAKLVFGAEGKRAYAYAKALDKAVQLGLGKEGGETFATHLKLNGGVNALIRNKDEDEYATDNADCSYKEFFELHIDKFSRNEKYYKNNSHLCIKGSDDFHKQLGDTNQTHAFFYATFDRMGKNVRLIPYFIEPNDKAFERMYEAFYNQIGFAAAKEDNKAWVEYLNMVEKRRQRREAEQQQKNQHMTDELDAIKALAA